MNSIDANKKGNNGMPDINTQCIMEAVNAGRVSLIITGNFKDYAIRDKNLFFKPFLLYEDLYRMGYIVILTSLSSGVQIFNRSSIPKEILKNIEDQLEQYGIHQNKTPLNEEMIRVLRGSEQILTQNQKFRIAWIKDYIEHLAPNPNHSNCSDEKTIAAETIHKISNNPQFRSTGNLLICISRDRGLFNPLLNDLENVDFNLPDEQETKLFAEVITEKIKNGETRYSPLSDDVTAEVFGRLTKGMKLKDCEDIFTEANIKNKLVTRKLITSKKAEAIIKNSEQTLTLIDTDKGFDSIIGLDNVKKELRRQSQFLKDGECQAAGGILLMGGSGTGKSTIVKCLGYETGFTVVKFERIKDSLVGKSEERMASALRNIDALAPCIVFIDEVDLYSVNRDNHLNTDSGVSGNIQKLLFEKMAQDNNKGLILFVGATNCPQNLDFAMLSRFSIKIPLPPPNIYEIPFHFIKCQLEITGKSDINPTDPVILDAAKIIWQKGCADGRMIRDLISTTDFTPSGILDMAKRFTGKAKNHDDIKSELTAYEMTQDKALYPWYGNQTYMLPMYLKDIVDLKTGDYDIVKSKERKQIL